MRAAPFLWAAIAALALAGCASNDSAALAKKQSQDSLQVEARLQRYAFLAMRMDNEGIASLFAPDGRLVREGASSLVGPDSIEKFLAGFVGYHVLEEHIAAETTVVRADSARQTGAWRQRVQVPDGKVVEVHGRFAVHWMRDNSDEWMIKSMGTTSTP
jgi:ketosteroid isomerase-like protein